MRFVCRMYIFFNVRPGGGGTWWRSWLRHCATSLKVAGSIPDRAIFRPHCGPGVDSVSNRNEYHEYF
jgi:hypothetical protein